MTFKHDIADLAKAVRLSPPVAFKFAGAGAGQGTFEGYASAFDNADSYGERVQPGAFAASLAAWKAENAMPPLFVVT